MRFVHEQLSATGEGTPTFPSNLRARPDLKNKMLPNRIGRVNMTFLPLSSATRAGVLPKAFLLDELSVDRSIPALGKDARVSFPGIERRPHEELFLARCYGDFVLNAYFEVATQAFPM